MKKFFKFNSGDEEITALVVGSKIATAKFILHVPEQTDGDKIFHVIKALDRKIHCTRKKNGKKNTHG